MSIPFLLIILIIVALLIVILLMVKNWRANDYRKMHDVQKKPPQVLHFLDIVYLLKAREMTDDNKILQALFMTWFKAWRIHVSLDPNGKQVQSDTAYVFFIPIHEQAPFEHESSHLLMRYCDVNKVSAYFYKPQARLEKEDTIVAFINNDPFWETVHDESKRIYETQMTKSKADEKTKEQIFEAVFEEVLPRTIEVYLHQGIEPEKTDLSDKEFQANLVVEVERQVDRSLQDIENTAQYSREFLQEVKWDEVMDEVMHASKSAMVSRGYLKSHNTFTEDVVTIHGHKLEKEMHAFMNYLYQFQKSQKQKPLAKNNWDDYLVWASLLGLEEELHQEMLAVDPTFENITLFPGKYAQGLFQYSKLLIEQNQ